jgi:hypothetical protein
MAERIQLLKTDRTGLLDFINDLPKSHPIHQPIQWNTDEILTACTCGEFSHHPQDWLNLNVSTGKTLECLNCGNWNRIYKSAEGDLYIGLSASMMEVEERWGRDGTVDR